MATSSAASTRLPTGSGPACQPARCRVQAAVDRRFNRRRYDAARTIATFSARLRQEIDLDTLSVELLALVGQTMQPASTSLWLRPQGADSATEGTVLTRT
jgi:hypothetical protein